MKRILVIDDDKENLSLVCEMLAGTFQALQAAGGQEGIRLATQEQPDLILLDVNMPGINGFEVCKHLRGQPSTRGIPVVFLTTVADIDSRVEGLNLGADDYITKPFHMRDLLARIQARLRRVELDLREGSALKVANLSLHPKSGEVRVNDQLVQLTRFEFELLRYFLDRANELLDRNVILGDLWPDAVVTPRTVDTHVGNLRRKLKGFQGTIKAVYGGGYILKVE